MRLSGVVCAVSIAVMAGSAAVAGEAHESDSLAKFNVLSHVPAQPLTAGEKTAVRGAFTLVLPNGVERTVPARSAFANKTWTRVYLGGSPPLCQFGEAGC